jgi:hypothetical protein
MNQQDRTKIAEDKSGKLSYSSPMLVEHGPVAKLVQMGNGSGTDGGTAGMSMVCL